MNKKMNKNIYGKKAILLWREKEFTNENLNQITEKDYNCIFKHFVLFSILKKNRELKPYRIKYQEITGKSWEIATIQDIYNAELVWGLS
jgi:hypothetical protein